MRKPDPDTGQRPPHGLRAEVTVTSGPHPPHGLAAVSNQGAAASADGGASASGAAPALAAEPEMVTRSETVAIRLSVPKPHPFSVFISTPEAHRIEIQAIEIHIYKRDRCVFNTVVGADLPLTLENPAESHVFPLTDEQLETVLPHLEEGNEVEVRVRYLAPDNSQLRIGIIGKHSHHTLGEFIEHLFHSD
ncbi:MAG: hypothetical protein ACR2JB_29205 [Bryobacteraceae bacterium]